MIFDPLGSEEQRIIQRLIDANLVKSVTVSGGLIGAGVGFMVGMRVFIKMVPEDDERRVSWIDVAFASGVFALFTGVGAIAGGMIGQRLIENC